MLALKHTKHSYFLWCSLLLGEHVHLSPPIPHRRVNACDAMMMTCGYLLCWCLPQSGGIKSMSCTWSFNCLSMKIMIPVAMKQIRYMFCTLTWTWEWETRNYCRSPRIKYMQSGGEASGNGNAGCVSTFIFLLHYLSLTTIYYSCPNECILCFGGPWLFNRHFVFSLFGLAEGFIALRCKVAKKPARWANTRTLAPSVLTEAAGLFQ